MSPTTHSSLPPGAPHRSDRGVTLILVLSIIALLLILVIGLLSSITSETTSAGSYAEGAAAKRLADSATEMVTSQIRLASSGSAVSTWTSQPGMLRTFDNTGSAKEIFKLYSAESMRVAAASYSETDDSLAETDTWSRAVFADINQPVINGKGALVYPIIDPAAATSSTSTGRQPVTGFELGTAPGYQAGALTSATNNPAAMPVRWLYLLKDGQIAVPQQESASGDILFSASNAQPSKANPVVGRVAFWTDDDTCKLNVNTAGYGLNDYSYWTYWDTPMIYSDDEQKFLSKNQPWTGEYQRYPGHPATTGLRLVFPELGKFDLFKVMPRLRAESGAAGSDGGVTDSFTASALALKQDRLYASIDEMLYTASRSSNLGTLSPADLDAKRFFLTAHSRAPEVNLFGQPRVSIWPIPNNTSDRTALDKLMALCGTVGSEKFYFTRQDSASSTSDIQLSDSYGSNLDLYSYLDRLTSRKVPGFGGPAQGFATKYGDDQKQILTGIYDTIRITNLAEKSPAAAYTSGTSTKPDQVMGQVIPTVHPTNGTRGAGRMFIITEATVVFVNMGSSKTDGSGYPGTTDKTKMKMGVILKFWLPEAGAIASGANFNFKITGLESFKINAKDENGTTRDLDLFNTARIATVSGTSFTVPTGTYQRGLREFRYAAVYGGANPAITAISDSEMGSYTTTSSSGTYEMPPTSDEITVTGNSFKFNGGTMVVEIRAPQSNISGPCLQRYTLSFPGITNALKVPPYNPLTDRPWNTLSAADNKALPAPFPNIYVSGSTPMPPFQMDGRFASGTSGLTFIQQYEVARSVQSSNGDYRALAYLGEIPANYFSTPPDYYTNYVQTQSLVGPGGWANQYGRAKQTGVTQCQPGNLVQGVKITGTAGTLAPDVPTGVNGVTNSSGASGDWDNGYGFLQDGCYLPKPDEGMLYTNDATNYATRGYFFSNATDKSAYQGNASTLFSANRQVPSAILFGSIPTGVKRNKPWQTLLFRPARSYLMGGTFHPGAATLPDYLFLDLFQMPVVEPYAISEPLSTAGKVNLNYHIKPFDNYLTRNTAIRSVIESTMLTAVPEAAEGPDQRGYMGTGTPPFAAYSGHTRWLIDSAETLKSFDQHLTATNKKVFVSESEICDVDLVPQGTTIDTLSSFWTSKRLTGDNSLERPYGLIYPRLTTRSNTFTVHVFAQALNPTLNNQGGWNARSGRVVGEWRGETTLERYVDPKDANIPSFLSGSDGILDSLYRFRVLSSKRFSP